MTKLVDIKEDSRMKKDEIRWFNLGARTIYLRHFGIDNIKVIDSIKRLIEEIDLLSL